MYRSAQLARWPGAACLGEATHDLSQRGCVQDEAGLLLRVVGPHRGRRWRRRQRRHSGLRRACSPRFCRGCFLAWPVGDSPRGGLRPQSTPGSPTQTAPAHTFVAVRRVVATVVCPEVVSVVCTRPTHHVEEWSIQADVRIHASGGVF